MFKIFLNCRFWNLNGLERLLWKSEYICTLPVEVTCPMILLVKHPRKSWTCKSVKSGLESQIWRNQGCIFRLLFSKVSTSSATYKNFLNVLVRFWLFYLLQDAWLLLVDITENIFHPAKSIVLIVMNGNPLNPWFMLGLVMRWLAWMVSEHLIQWNICLKLKARKHGDWNTLAACGPRGLLCCPQRFLGIFK